MWIIRWKKQKTSSQFHAWADYATGLLYGSSNSKNKALEHLQDIIKADAGIWQRESSDIKF